MRHPVHSNLLFLHSFQQGRLGAWSCPVNLIRQQDVDKYRAGPEFKLAVLLVEDRHTRHIIRQQVWGALQAFESAAQTDGNRARQHGFPRSGDIFKENVPFA
jgi:hypothetical protein